MTAKIKLNAASGGGSFSLQAPSSSSNNRVFTLPDSPDATISTIDGLTMADMWRLNADFSAGSSGFAFITANLERVDTYSFGQLGTGMTESSGVFSFPSTGIYHINFHLMCKSVYGELDYHFASIQATTDNSNYNSAAITVQEAQGTDHRYSMNVNWIFDVTNTSTHKVKFANYASRDDQTCYGHTDQTETSFTFLRLGDT